MQTKGQRIEKVIAQPSLHWPAAILSTRPETVSASEWTDRRVAALLAMTEWGSSAPQIRLRGISCSRFSFPETWDN